MKEIDLETVKQIQLLEPFGEANKMPQFLFKNILHIFKDICYNKRRYSRF